MTDESFRVALDRMLAEGYERMTWAQDSGEGLTVESVRRAYDQLGESPNRPPITVHHQAAYVPASLNLLVDCGAMSEDEARAHGWSPGVVAHTPPSRWMRLCWRWQAWRERAGRRVGSWLAGVNLTERDEDW